jgi:hypothetical protein
MKAITILQPWASLIACGAKKIETRGWATKYRGKIAIHAGKGKQNIDLCKQRIFWSSLWPYEIAAQYTLQERIDKFLPLGEVIAIADLVDCVKVIDFNYALNLPILEKDLTRKVITENELNFGDLSLGRYAWILDNVQAISPIAAKGQQRIWNWKGEINE